MVTLTIYPDTEEGYKVGYIPSSLPERVFGSVDIYTMTRPQK
jgi:hypothetical protein